MPANTPIYGFTYPCPGDTIDPAAFALLAGQIDTQLLSIQSDADYATGRHAYFITIPLEGTAIPVAVETPLTDPSLIYVAPDDGIYSVTVHWWLSVTIAVNAARMRVRLNGTPIFGRTVNTDVAAFVTPDNTITGALTVAAGDTIDLTVLFGGAGVGTARDVALSIRQIVRIL